METRAKPNKWLFFYSVVSGRVAEIGSDGKHGVQHGGLDSLVWARVSQRGEGTGKSEGVAGEISGLEVAEEWVKKMSSGWMFGPEMSSE
ncbi:MAG: hypothetical protein QHJ82_08400 [Verrucomicrobiota bacterium]|nr:hypothetical protein [Verrucomicrobiota bacterium]